MNRADDDFVQWVCTRHNWLSRFAYRKGPRTVLRRAAQYALVAAVRFDLVLWRATR